MSAEAPDRDRWVDKVRKLLAKAESTTSQAEADALFAKASDLITRWRIEDAELAASGRGPANDFVQHVIPLGSYSPVADMLAIKYVVEALGIHTAFTPYSPGRPATAHLYGWQSDVDKALMLWSAVSLQLVSSMKAEERRLKTARLSRGDLRTWRQSFKRGYSYRVRERLLESARLAKGEATPTGGALVLASRDDEARRLFEEQTGTSRRTSMKSNAHGLAVGRIAAERADLGAKRVGGTRGALR